MPRCEPSLEPLLRLVVQVGRSTYVLVHAVSKAVDGRGRVCGSHCSGVKPEALTAGAHNSESAFWMRPSSAADVPVGCRPKANRRSFTAGVCTAATMALLRRSTRSAGVLAGTNTPYQPAPWMS